MDNIDERFESLVLGDFIAQKPKENDPKAFPTQTVIKPTEHTIEKKIEIVHVEKPAERIIERERIIEKAHRPRATRKKVDPPKVEVPKRKIPVAELFEDLKIMIRLVANKIRPALFISGQSGASKTHTVTFMLEQELKKVEGVDFFFARGNTTPKGIYKTLHDWNRKLILFDDSDSAFNDPVSRNLIKGALDTTPVRRIVWISNDTFDPRRTSPDVQADLLAKGKLPSFIDFTGEVIFISNLKFEDVDSAIRTRCLVANVELTKEEFVEMMRLALPDIRPDVDMTTKESILEILVKDYSNEHKDLTFRTIVTAIELKASGVEEWLRIVSRYG